MAEYDNVIIDGRVIDPEAGRGDDEVPRRRSFSSAGAMVSTRTNCSRRSMHASVPGTNPNRRFSGW